MGSTTFGGATPGASSMPDHNSISRLIRVALRSRGISPGDHEKAIYRASASYSGGWPEVEEFAMDFANSLQASRQTDALIERIVRLAEESDLEGCSLGLWRLTTTVLSAVHDRLKALESR